MLPKISIVTPSYNQGRFLEETLRSVISQRDQVHEYFVFDGGSTDQSVSLIEKYAPSIDFWVSQKDEGQSDAIHKGFTRATGDFLFWLNSDDVVLPGAIKLAREALAANPGWDAITGYHVRTDGDSKIDSLHRPPRETFAKFQKGITRICQQTCYFRRKLYEDVGGVRKDLHCVMDTELFYRMMRHGSTWGHIPKYMAGYRWHSDSKLLGTAYQKRFAQEQEWLVEHYPECRNTPLHCAALAFYRIKYICSGQYFAARRDTSNYKGRLLSEVFSIPEATIGG